VLTTTSHRQRISLELMLMASTGTTPRKLDQIKWGKGITEGDIREGFFLELLNVEMDEGGRIRCRDGVILNSDAIPTDGSMKYVHINGDPTSNYDNGWNLFIGTDNLELKSTAYIYPWGESYVDGGPNSYKLVLPNVVDVLSLEVTFLGSTVYLSSIDPLGNVNQIISISWYSVDGMFNSPKYILPADDLYGQKPSVSKWIVNSLDESPEVRTFHTAEYGYNRAGRGEVATEIESWLLNSPKSKVALLVEFQRKDTLDSRAYGFHGNAIVEYLVVFVYSDGGISAPSGPAVVSIDAPAPTDSFDLGVSFAVSPDLREGISQIRLYRKVISGGISPMVDHELIMTAPIYDKNNYRDLHITPLSADGFRDLINPDESVELSLPPHYGNLPPNEDYFYIENENVLGFRYNDVNYPFPLGPVITQNYSRPMSRIGYGHLFKNGLELDTIKETSGWFKLRANLTSIAYMPTHLYNEGDVTVSLVGLLYHNRTGSLGIRVDIPACTRIFDKYNKTLIDIGDPLDLNFEHYDSMIVGCSTPTPFFIDDSSLSFGRRYVGPGTERMLNDHNMVGSDLICYRGYFKISESTNHELLNASPSAQLSTGTNLGMNDPGLSTTFAMGRDRGQTGQGVPSLETELGSIDVSTLPEVRPRHIGTAGGRLFGLNLVEDGVNKPSKLMYTEFGKFSSFRSDNFISYGVRDDGHGVAISSMKSYIIAHHSSSTYVFDISGGADLSWREVAAYYDVGCINKNLIAMTPFGVFWCDQSHLWMFAGKQPTPIEVEIKNIYRSIVGSAYRLLYREDLRQLWLLSHGHPVYVYDLVGGAWHTHMFGGSLTGQNIMSLFTVANIPYFSSHSSSKNLPIIVIGRFSKTAVERFNWTIDTGMKDMNVPEVIKKVRRVYLDMVRDNPYSVLPASSVSVDAIGDDGQAVSTSGEYVDGRMIRISASVRGYRVGFKIQVKEATFWRGYLNSLGISFKMKKLK